MRVIHLSAALVALAQPAAGAGQTFPPWSEPRIVAEINRARANPAAYAEELRLYRSWFDDRLVRIPGNPALIRTREGVAAVDDAIRFLEAQPPLPPLADSPRLRLAAADHVADQGPRGLEGHEGSNRSTSATRIRRRGGARSATVAEAITYGSANPVGVVRQLIIDDGVPQRGHRTLLFSPTYRSTGAACGSHARHASMCVIELSSAPGESAPAR